MESKEITYKDFAGKFKEAFFNYYYKGVKWEDEDVFMFLQDGEIIVNAYLINFFDSIGIFIYTRKKGKFWWGTYNGSTYIASVYCGSREVTTASTIRKAIDDFNNDKFKSI